MVLASIIDICFTTQTNHSFFYQALLLYLLLSAGSILIMLLYSYTWHRINNTVIYDIRTELYDSIISAQAADISKISYGEVFNKIDVSAGNIVFVIQRNFLHTINQILSYLMILFILFSHNLYVGLYFVIIIPIMIIMANRLGKQAKRATAEKVSSINKASSDIFNFFGGIVSIKILQAENRIKELIIEKIFKINEAEASVKKSTLYSEIGNRFLQVFSHLVLYVLGAVLILNNQLTIGLFIAILEYYYLAVNNLGFLFQNYVEWQSRKIYIDEVMEMMALSDEKKDYGTTKLESIHNITFENVGFGFNDENTVLKNVSFSITKGEKTALVGFSGQGKSTIARLILGFYKPREGVIQINGENLNQLDIEAYRNKIGILQQSAKLFPMSLKKNLTLKLKEENTVEADIWKALEKVGLADVIKRLPNQLETVADEKFSLSEGQLQRLLLARLIIKNPDVIILDEPASALDYENEENVMKIIQSLFQYKILICITHNVDSIREFEQILLVNKHTIEKGNHKNLSAQSQNYLKLLKGDNDEIF